MPLRDRVLAVLEENKGKNVSGSQIARSVGMTRSAVWKAVKQLRDEGYIIYAVTNKGYSLSVDNDFLSEHSVVPLLTTKHLGRKLDVFKTIDSTNIFAKSLAQLGAAHGSVVISDVQTQGKGQVGKSFYSPLGMGVYMSVIIRPRLSVEQSLLITSCAALAVCEAIENISELRCEIKWVNDILINGKKVCGILTEAAVNVEAGGLEYAVLGIGVNVQNVTFPKTMSGVATSLKIEAGRNMSRSKLAAEILNCLERRLDSVTDVAFIDDYRKRSVLVGKRVIDERSENPVPMTCLGIDASGRLVVQYDSGETQTLSSGSIVIQGEPESN